MDKGFYPPCTSPKKGYPPCTSPRGWILWAFGALRDPIWMIFDRFWHRFWNVFWLILDGFWMEFVRFLINIEKRRFYENERFAYTKHSFSWFQDMLLESKVRVQINLCCFSYFFCFAIRFWSCFIDFGFQNHFLKPWKWVFRVGETLIFIKSSFFDFNQTSYKIHPKAIQNQPKNTPTSMPKSITNHQNWVLERPERP